ncbi:MAG: MATE family efflux transporter [Bacteroidales bacterium]|nr:MATE family efflux transporter [Bacteroidales bacterium]
MKVANRIIFNTVVLYVKIILTTLIALVSVPLILKALGTDDYGLYNLVAGVVAMLSFLNASMAIATQRYISVAIGAHNPEKLNTIFNCAVLLHLLIGFILVVVFEICGLFIFDGFLNIHPDRIPAAETIYQFMVLSVFLNVITVPYGAVMNAKENMLAASVIGVIDSVLKLLLAMSLSLYGRDRLVFYGVGITFISLCNVIFSRSYVRIKYKEFFFSPKKYFDGGAFKSMFGFAGWNVFGAVANIGRNQGIAVVMNLFLGTAINAAYGIANQVNGALRNLTTVCRKAINPQLMQSEGMGDRDRLRRMAFVLSKVSFIILACFAVPLIVEMPYVIKLWINDAPAYTVAFCQLILVLSMLQQYSNGLMSAVQAVGKIGLYQAIMGILLLLNVPICYMLMKEGCPPYYCFVCFIVLEALSLLVRMLFAQSLANITIPSFATKVILPSLVSVGIALAASYPLHLVMDESFLRLVCVAVCYMIVYMAALWFICIDKYERKITSSFLYGIKKLF